MANSCATTSSSGSDSSSSAALENMTSEVYEFMVSLACGAATSYRKGTILNPFPKAFLTTDTKDKNFDRLATCLLTMPSSSKIFLAEASSSSSNSSNPRSVGGLFTTTAAPTSSAVDDSSSSSHGLELDMKRQRQRQSLLTEDQKKLLQFFEQDCVKLRCANYQQIGGFIGNVSSTLRPDFVYEIIHDDRKPSNQEFLRLKPQYGSRMAFHGSAAENWFSIVNTGLRNFSGTDKQRTGALFGEGIYLSTTLQVAVDFSRSGECWSQGVIVGSKVRIVGLCEVIAHPDYCCSSSTSSTTVESDNQRSESSIDITSAGPSPETYLIVPNAGHVRVKYLLVYSERASCSSYSSSSDMASAASAGGPRGLLNALAGYWGSAFWILLYLVILISIILSQAESKTFFRYCFKTASRRGKSLTGFLF